MSLITFAELIKEPPRVHAGRTVTWQIHPDLAMFLDETLQPGHVTFETGSGLSTLVILRKQVTQHIAVAPDPDEFEVIRGFCQARGLDTRPLNAIVAQSQDYLPFADLPALDLALIDGDHCFPLPFIDWFYTANKLKVGGWLVVDDADIVTGTFLADFMRADPKWQEVKRHPASRFAIYKKLQHPIHDGNWWNQPYLKDAYPTKLLKIVRRRPPGLLERTLAKTLPWRLVQVPLKARFDWPRRD
jgi:hypothetical protein